MPYKFVDNEDGGSYVWEDEPITDPIDPTTRSITTTPSPPVNDGSDADMAAGLIPPDELKQITGGKSYSDWIAGAMTPEAKTAMEAIIKSYGTPLWDTVKKAFTNPNDTLNLPGIAGLVGAGLGAAGFGQAKITPTGYQGGIPQLTASQPMLTEPPPGRRPGSGGINYSTGVQYRDKNGNIVSDTSTPVADLYKKATQEGTYNDWGHQYGKGTTGATNAANDQSGLLALLQKLQAAQAASTATPLAGLKKIASAPTGTTGTTTPNTGVASALPSASASASANSTASTPTGGGFTAGGGGPPTDAEYAKMVAVETARRNAEQAALDKYHVAPDSPFYSAYMAATGQRKDDIKSQDKDFAERMGYRTSLSNMGYGDGFFVTGGGLYDQNHNLIPPTANEVSNTLTDAKTGRPRYETKAEEAARLNGVQTYLQSHGNIIDTNKPWNIASTDASTQSAQQALAQLNANPGADPQATLKNFLKTTTFTPEQLSAASNGQWAISDLSSQMAGNPNLPEQGGPKGQDKTSAGDEFPDMTMGDPSPFDKTTSTPEQTAEINAILTSLGVNGTGSNTTPAPVKFGGIQDEPTTTPSPVKFGGIQNEPAAPLTGLAALNAAAQTTYGRALTDAEQQALSGKSLEDAQGIMTQSMANWNASHPSTPQVDTPSAQPDYNQNYGFAQGGIAGLKTGRYLQGATDGMADKLPTTIDGNEPAALSHGEFVVPADIVSHLGNGNSDAGAKKLYSMMDKIRMARTGTKKQGKEINPDKFMPGGLARAYAEGGAVKGYAGTDPTGSLVQAGVTGTEQNLSNWSGPAVTQMLGQAQALANTPYQAYTGPLTAGASDLQNQAFNTAANLPGGNQVAAYGNMAVNNTYTPQTTSFGTAQAQQYMNPYLQASLDPQLAEARRQSQVTAQNNAASMTKAGAFGGGRQAIMSSENDRNLGTKLADITGQGYNTAYTNAMGQFNADQNRLAQESQFGATNKLAGLNTGIGAEQAASGIGINNLNTQATLGATQRGIEGEGIAADKKQFEEARVDPYSKLQYLQSMFNGLPITAQNYNMSTPSTLQQAISGAGGLAGLFGNKTNLTLTDVKTALANLGINV